MKYDYSTSENLWRGVFCIKISQIFHNTIYMYICVGLCRRSRRFFSKSNIMDVFVENKDTHSHITTKRCIQYFTCRFFAYENWWLHFFAVSQVGGPVGCCHQVSSCLLQTLSPWQHACPQEFHDLGCPRDTSAASWCQIVRS